MFLELFLIVVLVVVVWIALRRGPAKVEDPLIFEESGRYHITLWPQLQFARETLEQLAVHLLDSVPMADTPTVFFGVRHPHSESELYLLALAYRRNICFIQAIAPKPMPQEMNGRWRLVSEFSDAVLQHYPLQSLVAEKSIIVARVAADFFQRRGIAADILRA
ncbi:MAG: hypothetical protein U1C96_02005 [Gallionella sp.]|nr:hypothetical protein [Gallionella sp.]